VVLGDRHRRVAAAKRDNPIDPTDVCRRVVPACQSTDTYPALWPSCTHPARPAEPTVRLYEYARSIAPRSDLICGRARARRRRCRASQTLIVNHPNRESNPAFALHLRSRAKAQKLAYMLPAVLGPRSIDRLAQSARGPSPRDSLRSGRLLAGGCGTSYAGPCTSW
jgi:hypothetical protein